MKTYLIIYFMFVILSHCVNLHATIMDDNLRESILTFISLIITIIAAACFGRLI